MPIYTVSQISEAIKKTLEGSFPSLQIKGEISNLRFQSSGHYYFTLKDEMAQLSCALFRMDAMRLKKPLKDGDMVTATGSISVFPPKGGYQLIVKSIETEGLGDLLLRFEALKKKYQEMGYFSQSVKKQLPRFPKKIGIVTSPTGAVIQDILQTLKRRYKGFHVILAPTKVQGDGAKEEIVSSIEFFNQHKLCDVIIVARGGGSLEDLNCFNQEEVVEAIHKSSIPVISAVGHETDFTLCDFVSDLRAPTPTAAAEIVMPELNLVLQKINQIHDAIKKLFQRRLNGQKQLLEQIKKRPELTSSSALLKTYFLHLDRLESKLEPYFKQNLEKTKQRLYIKKAELEKLSPINQLKDRRLKLQQITQKTSTFLPNVLEKQKVALAHLKSLLQAVNPMGILDKGYAMVIQETTGDVISSIYQLSENDDLRLQLKDGSLKVKVKQKTLI
jgi:exodeoxyribonuclease VII large subunit